MNTSEISSLPRALNRQTFTNMQRLYPSYTLAELETFIAGSTARPPVDADTAEKMKGEIARRKSGESKPKVTPVVPW